MTSKSTTMHVCSLIYHFPKLLCSIYNGIFQQQLIGDYGMLTVMKPCPVALLANGTDVKRSFTSNCNHEHTHADMHKLRHTYISLHTMTWPWRDLDEIHPSDS